MKEEGVWLKCTSTSLPLITQTPTLQWYLLSRPLKGLRGLGSGGAMRPDRPPGSSGNIWFQGGYVTQRWVLPNPFRSGRCQCLRLHMKSWRRRWLNLLAR